MIKENELLIKARKKYKRKINRWKRKIERQLIRSTRRDEILINCGGLPMVVIALLLKELSEAGWDVRIGAPYRNDALIIRPRFSPK